MQSHRAVRRNPARADSPLIDRLAGTVGLLMPLFTIPQIVSIWSSQSAAGASLWTWGAFLSFSVLWFVYALYHRDRPLIILHVLWIVTQSAVVAGIVLYS